MGIDIYTLINLLGNKTIISTAYKLHGYEIPFKLSKLDFYPTEAIHQRKNWEYMVVKPREW